MVISRMAKSIIADIQQTLTEIRGKDLLLEEKGVAQMQKRGNTLEISFPGKNNASGIVYDKHISSSTIINELLSEKQYNILFYDKGFIQAEFIVCGDKVIKERLVFMKKHNKVWGTEEILEYEVHDEDWFAEEAGVPIMLRIDYAPESHKECEHAAAHLTISNHESCRIPIKSIVTFSEFVRFVLLHFYNIKLDLKPYRFGTPDTITGLEQQMIHINWQ